MLQIIFLGVPHSPDEPRKLGKAPVLFEVPFHFGKVFKILHTWKPINATNIILGSGVAELTAFLLCLLY